MATIKDVAQLAGVGLGTASRALNGGSVSDSAKAKVMQAAKQLNFVPNRTAQNMRTRSSGCVALIIPTIDHPFFSKFAYYLENELYNFGYRMIVVNSQDDREKEQSMLEMIKEKRVDGIIFSTHYSYTDLDENLPIVTIDGHLGSFTCVTSDNFDASKRAVKYMYERGSKNIGCICGTTEAISETSYRFQGYEEAAKELGMKVRLYKENFKHGEENDAAGKFLEAYPDVDGVLACTDALGVAIYNKLKSLGKSVPHDVQIVGYDGVLDSNYIGVKLTVVKQDLPKMARYAAQSIIDKLNRTQRERIEAPTTFVVGDTTR